MATYHHIDKRHQPNKGEAVMGLVRLVAAAFSIWQLRKQAPLVSAPPPRIKDTSRKAGRRPELTHTDAPQEHGKEAQAHKEEAAALKQSSYPKALLRVAIDAAKAWSSHRAASKGAALALYTLFSLAPMLILVVTLAGLFFGADTVRELLVQQISGLMGSESGGAIETMLAGGSKHEKSGAIAGLVSAALVLVSATSAFSELKNSLDELWDVPPSTKTGLWSMIRERFLSFGIILVLVLMLLTSLTVSTALDALGQLWGGGEVGSAFKVIATIISHAVSFFVVTALFAVIFKYMPAVKIAWKDVIIGALITAVLFIIGKSLIGLYVAHADISSSYGAAGSIVIMITWIYYSAQIFFYGSLFTHEYAMKMGSRSPGAPNQQPASGKARLPAASTARHA